MYFAPGDATNLCLQPKKEADASGLRGALCIFCIFGQTLKPDYRKFKYEAALSDAAVEKQDGSSQDNNIDAYVNRSSNAILHTHSTRVDRKDRW